MYSLFPFIGVWTVPVVIALSLLCSWWCGDIFSTFNIDDAKFTLLFAFAGKGLHDELSRSLSNSCKWNKKKMLYYIERECCSSILIMASAFNFKTDNYLINETNKTAYEQMYFRIFTRNNKNSFEYTEKIVCENDFYFIVRLNLLWLLGKSDEEKKRDRFSIYLNYKEEIIWMYMLHFYIKLTGASYKKFHHRC